MVLEKDGLAWHNLLTAMPGVEGCDAAFQFAGMSLFGLSRLGGGSKQRQGVDTEVAAVAEAEGQRVGQDDAGAAPHPAEGGC